MLIIIHRSCFDVVFNDDCWPLTKFWITLVMFDHFWDFDSLVKDGAPRQRKDHGISLPFYGIFGFRAYVTGMGCQPMGLPMLRPHF
jgi:hypothetical protein